MEEEKELQENTPKKKIFTRNGAILLLAILVIAAAVCIPLAVHLHGESAKSPDEHAVLDMNKALQKAGAQTSVDDAMAVLEGAGYNMPPYAITANCAYYYLQSANQIVLVEMKNHAPVAILYPEDAAEAYEEKLPTEGFFPMVQEEEQPCDHSDVVYYPVLNDDKTSSGHIAVCKTCGKVVGESEPHTFTDGVCTKCHYQP